MKSYKKVFNKETNRLVITLLLLIAYPIWWCAFFALFVFVIIPMTSLVHFSATAMYVYWMIIVLLWIILIAICFPLMKNKIIQPVIGLQCVVTRKTDYSENETDELLKIDQRNSYCSLKVAKSNEKDDLERNQTQKAGKLCIKETENNSSLEESQVLLPKPCNENESKNVGKLSCSSPKSLHGSEEVEQKSNALLEINEETAKKEERNVNTLTAVEKTDDGMEEQSEDMKAPLTISPLSALYECSLPSPTSPDSTEKNTVFLFINRDL